MALHNELGKKGENIAKAFLEGKGYKILNLNWRCGRAEVDLIAFFDKRIIFVEVKTRSSSGFGMPEEFVGYQKQKNLRKAAEAYIYMKKFNGEIRFDVISILFDKKGEYELNHIEDAFW